MAALGFNACRKCLTPGTDVQLTSMFDLPVKLEVFEAVAEIEFSYDKGKYDALVCQTCVSEVDEAFEFRQRILDVEVKYFKPRREKVFVDLQTGIDNSSSGKFVFEEFKVCRCCLTSSAEVETTTIFKEFGQNGMEYVEMLFHFTDFNMTIDYQWFDGLICVSCIEELEKFFKIRESMKQAEISHFYPQRKKLKPKQVEPKVSTQSQKRRKSQQRVAESAEAATKTTKQKSPKKLQVEPVRPTKVQKETKWKCSVCGKFLCDSRDLRRHLDAVHAKIKNFACDICGHSVYRKFEMKSHMKRNHIEPKINPKPWYDKTRPFPCKVEGCSRSFTSKPDLVAHQKVHSDERPFECHCGKSYKFKPNLQRHQQSIHKSSKDKNWTKVRYEIGRTRQLF